MQSIIQITCPHCGASGQVFAPPMGALVFGPCPHCHELLLVFCGHALPVDREIMVNGAQDDQVDHIMHVLTQFISERVSELVSQDAFAQLRELEHAGGEQMEGEFDEGAEEDAGPWDRAISEEDMNRFVTDELHQIDDKDYFNSVFNTS